MEITELTITGPADRVLFLEIVNHYLSGLKAALSTVTTPFLKHLLSRPDLVPGGNPAPTDFSTSGEGKKDSLTFQP